MVVDDVNDACAREASEALDAYPGHEAPLRADVCGDVIRSTRSAIRKDSSPHVSPLERLLLS